MEDFCWKDSAAGLRGNRCTSCRRAYQREWYTRNSKEHRERNQRARRQRYSRNRALVDHLKDVACADCGGRFHPEQMDFDHVRGQKSFNIGEAMWSRSVDSLEQEIEKCEVVCSVCHRIRTTKRARA